MLRTVKLFRPSRLLGTMASADFSQFVVTTDRAPSVRPHGINPEPFPVYSPDLRIEVTVAFGTLMSLVISSAQYALISGFCPSSHGFAIASSRLYLTVQTLQITLRFVGNYAPRDFHPRFGTCPSYQSKSRLNKMRRLPKIISVVTVKLFCCSSSQSSCVRQICRSNAPCQSFDHTRNCSCTL